MRIAASLIDCGGAEPMKHLVPEQGELLPNIRPRLFASCAVGSPKLCCGPT